jgi:hypothetical protein
MGELVRGTGRRHRNEIRMKEKNLVGGEMKKKVRKLEREGQ